MEKKTIETEWCIKLKVKTKAGVQTLNYWKTYPDFFQTLLFYDNDQNFEIINIYMEKNDQPLPF